VGAITVRGGDPGLGQIGAVVGCDLRDALRRDASWSRLFRYVFMVLGLVNVKRRAL
jgi:hypothetical protein